MKTEYEARILEIDADEIKKRLESIGAEKRGEKIQRRYVYDLIPKRDNSWMRLRTNGKNTTLTIKEIETDKIDGTKEIEVKVDDFDKTNLLLNKLGFYPKGYQENKRISYLLHEVEIEIDFWPKIPPYLEIEGKSTDEVRKTIALLGFDISESTSINTKEIYRKYGIDLESIKELKF